MARTFAEASSQWIQCGGGALNGQVWDYGAIGVIFRKTATATNAAVWRGLTNLDSGAAAYSADLEFDTADSLQIYYDGSSSAAYGSWTSTTTWYCLVVSKATGSSIPRVHFFDYTALTWSHVAASAALPNGTTSFANVSVGSFTGTGDYFSGEIEAVGYWRHWVPSDAEVESVGLHLSRLAWLETTTRADKSWVSFLDQRVSSDPLADWTGGGGNQSSVSASVPTVSTTGAPLLAYGAPVALANPSSAGVVATVPPASRYIYMPAVQRAATW